MPVTHEGRRRCGRDLLAKIYRRVAVEWLSGLWKTVKLLFRLHKLEKRVKALEKSTKDRPPQENQIIYHIDHIGHVGQIGQQNVKNPTRQTVVQKTRLQFTRDDIYTSNVAHTGEIIGLVLAVRKILQDKPDRIKVVADELEDFADDLIKGWTERLNNPEVEKDLELSDKRKQTLLDQIRVKEAGIRAVAIWLRGSFRDKS